MSVTPTPVRRAYLHLVRERMLKLEEENERLQAVVDAAREECSRQAEDPGLWFVAETAPEEYLQAALRKLHRIIEQDGEQLSPDVTGNVTVSPIQADVLCQTCGGSGGEWDNDGKAFNSCPTCGGSGRKQ